MLDRFIEILGGALGSRIELDNDLFNVSGRIARYVWLIDCLAHHSSIVSVVRFLGWLAVCWLLQPSYAYGRWVMSIIDLRFEIQAFLL